MLSSKLSQNLVAQNNNHLFHSTMCQLDDSFKQLDISKQWTLFKIILAKALNNRLSIDLPWLLENYSLVSKISFSLLRTLQRFLISYLKKKSPNSCLAFKALHYVAKTKTFSGFICFCLFTAPFSSPFPFHPPASLKCTCYPVSSLCFSSFYCLFRECLLLGVKVFRSCKLSFNITAFASTHHRSLGASLSVPLLLCATSCHLSNSFCGKLGKYLVNLY